MIVEHQFKPTALTMQAAARHTSNQVLRESDGGRALETRNHRHLSAACFAAFLFAFDELPNFGDFDNCEHLGAVSTYGRGTRFRFGGAVPVNGFLNPRCLAHPPEKRARGSSFTGDCHA